MYTSLYSGSCYDKGFFSLIEALSLLNYVTCPAFCVTQAAKTTEVMVCRKVQ